MEYWFAGRIWSDPPPSLQSKKLARDDYMGQNILYLIDKERPKTKFIIWAYNDHIAVDSSDGKESPGYQMRKWFGDKYYALALACYEGTFQTRVLLPGFNYWGALKIDTIPPFEKSINWYLHNTNKKQLLVDFRSSSSNALVEKWLETSQKFSSGVWKFGGASATYGDLTLKGKYDGILFIEQSAQYTQPGMHWKKVQKMEGSKSSQTPWNRGLSFFARGSEGIACDTRLMRIICNRQYLIGQKGTSV